MPHRPPAFSPTQWTVLGLLAAGTCAVLATLALFVSADLLAPPAQVVALAARPTLTPRPLASAAPPTETPSAAVTPLSTATATGTATRVIQETPTPTPTPTNTPLPSNTPTPTPTATHTPLWPSAVPRAWPTPTASAAGLPPPPTLADFWDGRAAWQLDVFDVGLPMGESDTLVGPDGQLWSYLHASWDSRGIVDQWGERVPFPGCATLWQSADRGRSFRLYAPRCIAACRGYPCGAIADDIDQQQYPRVARSDGGVWVMVYEWRAQLYLRASPDGLNWTRSRRVPGTGVWMASAAPCRPYERIGPHPFVPAGYEYDCLAGAPPGLYIEGEQMWVFAGLGKNPGHMGCFSGPVAADSLAATAGLRPCAANPLFQGAAEYGPLEAVGAAANPYFDFRTVSSAEVVRVGDRYYMAYEGVRGPTPGAHGDTQFNLGFARSRLPAIDGPWEKFPGNPVLGDVPGNVGLGHADLVVLDGVTYLYTATSEGTRGRYVLMWK